MIFPHFPPHNSNLVSLADKREFQSETGFFFIFFFFFYGVPEKMYCMGNNNDPSDLSTEGEREFCQIWEEESFPPSPNSQSVSSSVGETRGRREAAANLI